MIGLSIPPSRNLIPIFRDHLNYLNQFPVFDQSTYFERVCAYASARLFGVPFFDATNDDERVEYRLTWNGEDNPPGRAPDGPDAIVRCHEFDLLLEVTLKEGNRQWAQEYSRAIDHWRDYCDETDYERSNIYVLFVCPHIHQTTLNSIVGRPDPDFKMIPIEIQTLLGLLRTSYLSLTITHAAIRRILMDLYDCAINNPDVDSFQQEAAAITTSWVREILVSERDAFLAVQSYRAMRRIGGTYIGSSNIYHALLVNPTVSQYFGMLGSRFSDICSIDDVARITSSHGFALRSTRTFLGELILEPVTLQDYKARSDRLMFEAMQRRVN